MLTIGATAAMDEEDISIGNTNSSEEETEVEKDGAMISSDKDIMTELGLSHEVDGSGEEGISLEQKSGDETMVDIEDITKDISKISFDDITATEPSSSLEVNSSDDEGRVLVGMDTSTEDYNVVSTEDAESDSGSESGSEFSFNSNETLGDNDNMNDGFVDLAEPFDMELLRSCIENGSPVLEKVRDKHVVLVVGKTGVGKSLFIQGIAGKQIVCVEHQTDYSGETVIKKVFEAKDPVPGFEVGHKKVSKTRSINCFIQGVAKSSKKEVVYLDSPGFEDTAGPEVDIATSVMLSQVAKSARSLRFVVLINYASLLEDRGGAMRAVLKLAQTFVSDFETDKKSFMFLFTHAMTDLPDATLESARKRLAKEILCILEGTNDSDVEKVLKFMHKSITKKYMFVDILHPLLSDFKNISSFVKNKLSTIKNPALGTNCGLTIQSQMKLTSQIQCLLLRLRTLFEKTQNSDESLQELKHIRETFRYFSRYIGISKVQEAANECEHLFDKHIAVQRDVVESSLERATDRNARFDSGIARVLKFAVTQLAAFSGDGNQEYNEKRINHAFCVSYDWVMSYENVFLLEDVLKELGKMKAWSESFEEFVSKYAEACNFVLTEIDKDCTNVLSVESIPVDICADDLVAHVRKLVCHQQRAGMNHRFLEHQIDMSLASNAVRHLESHLSTLATKWGEQTSCEEEETCDSIIPILQLAVERAGKLEFVQSQIDIAQFSPDLAQVIVSTVSEIQALVAQGIIKYCDHISATELTAGTKDKVRVLTSIVSSTEQIQGGSWKNVFQPYRDLLERIKSELKGRSGAIERSARLCELTVMRDGKQEAEQLVAFREFTWFDSLTQYGFVQQDFERLHMIYLSIMEIKMDQALGQSKKLSPASKEDLEILKACHQAASESKEFEAFEAEVGFHGTIREKKKEIITCMKVYREELIAKSKQWSNKWYSHLNNKEFDDAHVLTETLDIVLGEIELIETFDCMPRLKEDAATAKECILNKFKLSKDYVDAEFAKPTNYTSMFDCLVCMSKVSGFPRTDPKLPTFSDYKEKARAMISNKADKLERMLEESADQNEIDKCWQDLNEAKVLDPYTNDEAMKRLRPLGALREKKANETDELLEGMIEREDFKGMGLFLKPLHVSKDVIKKKKCNQYKQRITSAIKLRVKASDAKFSILTSQDHVETVGNTIRVLKDASKEIGFIFDQSELNIASEANRLQGKLNDKARFLTQGILNGYKTGDFYVMGKNQHLAELIREGAGSFLYAKVKFEYDKANSTFTTTLYKEIPQQLETFCSSLFQDYKRLNRTLPSLKVAANSKDPELPKLRKLYREEAANTKKKIEDTLHNVCENVVKTDSYDDGIEILEAFMKAKTIWMEDIAADLPFDIVALLDDWKKKQAEQEKHLESNQDARQRFHFAKMQLDKQKNCNWFVGYLWNNHKSYDKLQARLDQEGQEVYSLSRTVLREQNWPSLKRHLDVLSLMERELASHVMKAGDRRRQLESSIVDTFFKLCQESVNVLKAANIHDSSTLVNFRRTFPDLRQCVLQFPFVLDRHDASKEFCLVTQLVHGILKEGITSLKDAISSYEFSKARELVLHNRTEGAFLVDNYVLLGEELKQQDRLVNERWLAQISQLSNQHFSSGRDLSNIKECAILGVLPSASEDDIKKAYKRKALEVHPDRRSDADGIGNVDNGEDFRRLKDSYELLLSTRSREKANEQQCFDSLIRSIPENLNRTTRQHLRDQKYDSVELLLERLSNFEMICNLVTPPLNQDSVRSSILKIVQDHVHGLKVDVETQWNDRKYKELNYSINYLKQMENHLKSFPDVFPESWNRVIVENVEREIESLGQKARSILRDKKTATDSADDFRRFFIQMGHVLVELQSFKEYTKSVMYGVLESCLNSGWGYSYLFELGLSFHRGDESLGEDENRIAQALLSEFTHFKEVATMIWNEETAQKPPEDTVKDIFCETIGQEGALSSSADVDRDALLQSFYAFDTEYTKLLGDYLDEDADVRGLADKAVALACSLKPLSCDLGWNDTVIEKLPLLFAAVFALFTIMKSGESFHRIQKSEEAQHIGEKLLMKPHNIQVLNLLHTLGCGRVGGDTSLENQLRRIRTGEGKSIILGALSAILGLLGFKVRCVCYSDYLSQRDYSLFEEVFLILGLDKSFIIYSKITAFSENTTTLKGNIRALTESLLRQKLPQRTTNCAMLQQQPEVDITASNISPFCDSVITGATAIGTSTATAVVETNGATAMLSDKEEILLVDEVDVFFGPDFYGKTYNQVMELSEPEVSEILSNIWTKHVQVGQKQRLTDIQASTPYKSLVQKMPMFKSLIDNEIRLMLDHVRRVDEEKYYLDADQDRIGYKVHDTISYQATYGYRTVFAYLKEAEAGNLRDKDSTLRRVLNMPIQCGQFSYANISPKRILGVSGTLEGMSDYQKDVLRKYGIEKLVHVPSVYGKSNFTFDRAADGIFIEPDKSDYFQKICEEIQSKIKQNRAVIVFFEDNVRLAEFKSSPFFPRLGRQKAILSENMESGEKEFVINKAATSGQVTLCPAVFGRGTDFFCKDERVQNGGGVHIIQTFLSLEKSEEVQIQGRTSRQGKKGSYQLVLLEDDLCKSFDVSPGDKDTVPRKDRYDWLCDIRDKKHKKHWDHVNESLKIATARDATTHEYFDALLDGKQAEATELFQELYATINKPPIADTMSVDIGLLLDITGSMSPYSEATVSAIKCLIRGKNSVLANLKTQFPDTEINLRLGVLGYRDIDDGNAQFSESIWQGGDHFTESSDDALAFIESIMSHASGGNDLAEDHLGAISQLLSWNGPSDWSSQVKMAVMFTDAPAHGLAQPASLGAANLDRYSVCHPNGLTPSSIAGDLAAKEVNLIFCSYSPHATARTEEELSREYLNHPLNSEGREIKTISMIPKSATQASDLKAMAEHCSKHIVFILDESGSMQYEWNGVVRAFHKYISSRLQNQNESDLVSVVQFDSQARVTVQKENIRDVASRSLDYSGGGTRFAPAALEGSQLAVSTPLSHEPTVVFMSDGGTNDASEAASTFAALNQLVKEKHGRDLDLHVIGFGGGADTQQMQQISRTSPKGRVHLSSDAAQLTSVFVDIAGGQQVATILQEEIGKEISEAVSDTLCLGYLS